MKDGLISTTDYHISVYIEIDLIDICTKAR